MPPTGNVNVRFPFNQNKAAQAAAHLLQLRGGRLDYSKLISLLYLADRHALVDRGLPITGGTMVSTADGLVLAEASKLIESDKRWTDLILPLTGQDIWLSGPAPDNSALSIYEIQVLAKIDSDYGRMDSRTLTDLLRSLKEWSNPGARNLLPVDLALVLRSEGWSEQEIQELFEDAEELKFLEG
jgi:hypothetical protein